MTWLASASQMKLWIPSQIVLWHALNAYQGHGPVFGQHPGVWITNEAGERCGGWSLRKRLQARRMTLWWERDRVSKCKRV